MHADTQVILTVELCVVFVIIWLLLSESLTETPHNFPCLCCDSFFPFMIERCLKI